MLPFVVDLIADCRLLRNQIGVANAVPPLAELFGPLNDILVLSRPLNEGIYLTLFLVADGGRVAHALWCKELVTKSLLVNNHDVKGVIVIGSNSQSGLPD